jgi:hypothetical protein
MPPWATTPAQRLRSLSKKLEKSAGDIVFTSAPCAVRRERTSGDRMMRVSSADSLASTAGGVAAGTSAPCQVPDSKPFTPCSAMVGTLPSSGMRVAFDTPSTLSLPLCTNGSVASMPFISTWVWPAIVSVMACEPPLYGMYSHLAPVAFSTATPATCGALPIAVTAKLSLLVFDSATSSCRLLAGTEGCTTSMCGEYASIVTPFRSLLGSNGSLA